MKTLKSLVLRRFEQLDDKELKILKGGCDGICGCRKDNEYNASANMKCGYHVAGAECEVPTYYGGNPIEGDEWVVYGTYGGKK